MRRAIGINWYVILFALFLGCAIPAAAQNTKGDKPIPKTKESKEARFKIRKKQGDRARTRDIAGRRLRTKNYHSAGRAYDPAEAPAFRRKDPRRGYDRPNRSAKAKQSTGPHRGRRPWRGDITGRRIRTSEPTRSARARNYYPPPLGGKINTSGRPGGDRANQTGPRVKVKPQSPSSHARRTYNPRNFPKAGGTSYSRRRNVYRSRGTFVNNPSGKPGSNPPKWPAKTTRVRARGGPSGRARVTYNARNFPKARGTSQGRRANVYSSSGAFVNNPSRAPRSRMKPISNQAQLARTQRLSAKPPRPSNKKRVAPRTASRSYISSKSINYMARYPKPKSRRQLFFGKDLTGHPLRRRNYRSPTMVFEPSVSPYSQRGKPRDQAYTGKVKGYKSATRTKPRAWTGDIAGRTIRGKNYRSNIPYTGKPVTPIYKSRKRVGDAPYKGIIPGGGARSSTGPYRSRSPIAARAPGNVRELQNYRGRQVMIKGFGLQGADYRGNIKANRPSQGGKSISGFWNNNGRAITGRAPTSADQRIARYQGNLKRFGNRPTFGEQGANYAGNIKVSKAGAGAGKSVSGFWNNNGRAVTGRAPTSADQRIARYQGNLKRFGNRPTFGEQGANYAGNIKVPKERAGAGKSISGFWNNEGKAIQYKVPSSGAVAMARYHGKTRVSRPLRGGGESVSGTVWNNNQQALKVRLPKDPEAWRIKKFEGNVQVKARRPNRGITQGLQVRVKEENHRHNPASAAGSLKVVPISRAASTGSRYSKGVRRDWKYVRNPNSADEAIKVREPGRVTARAASFQGNFKTRGFSLFSKNEAYPDARFEKSDKTNVEGERGILNSLHLLWSRWFGHNQTLPDNVKEKPRRPRFDKGEQGLWYD